MVLVLAGCFLCGSPDLRCAGATIFSLVTALMRIHGCVCSKVLFFVTSNSFKTARRVFRVHKCTFKSSSVSEQARPGSVAPSDAQLCKWFLVKFYLDPTENLPNSSQFIANIGTAWLTVMGVALMSMGSKEMYVGGGHPGEVCHM